MNCETCTYRYECASADAFPENVECGLQAEIIDLAGYRRAKGMDTESLEDRLFGEIDEVFARTWRWVIGMGIVYILAQLLRVWLDA